MILPAGPLKRLHVNKQAVKSGDIRVWTIRAAAGPLGWQTFHVVGFTIQGPSVSVYRPENPLQPEGTYAWIETTAAVSV